MTVKDVFVFYNEKVKVLYSDIEARNNTLPVELLFEINSAFDHLKRIYVDGEAEEKACEKAFSHLKRGLLDAFKLKLKYHNIDYRQLMESKGDLKLIDNGQYFPSLLKDRALIIQKAKEARLHEGKFDIETSFKLWCEVSDVIDSFEQKYLDFKKINWAKKNQYIKIGASFIIGIVTGIISSIIVACIF